MTFDYCPQCGSVLTSLEMTTGYRCETCEEYVFENPGVTARVIVVDDDRLLLVAIADEARVSDPPYGDGQEWETAGGHVEVPEQPADCAVRELEEETGLAVDPADLALFESATRQVVPERYGVSLLYAVPREEARGTLSAGSDAAAARFWRPSELAAASAHSFREFHDEPAHLRTPSGLLERASAAIEAEP